MRDAGAPLPRWARISKRQDVKETPLSTKKEEDYIKTRMHQSMASRIDEALQDTLQAQVSPVVEDIVSFFQTVSPSDSGERRPNKRSRPDLLVAMFEMEPQQRYPATLLPLAVLHGPASFLDRQEIIKYMVHKIRQDEKENELRPAMCWLRNTGSSSIHHSGAYLKEILNQCIAQEPDPKQFLRLFHRTKSSGSSFSKAILTWAQLTVCFGSIIVLIDHVECIPSPLFQDFLQLLTSLRSENGLPLQVVLLAPPGRVRQMRLDSATQGMVGIMIRDFSLPTSSVLYDCVWERVFIEQPLPVSLAPSVLRSIHEAFDHHHSSAVRAMVMLKQALAHMCTQRGIFLLGMKNASCLEDERNRIQFLLHNSDTLPVLARHAEETDCQRTAYSAILHVLRQIGSDVGGTTPSVVEWIEQEFSAICFNAIRARLQERFGCFTHSERIACLAQLRKHLQDTNRSSDLTIAGRTPVPARLRNLLSQLNRLILLVDGANDEEEVQKGVSEMFVEWVHNVSIVGAALQTRRSDDSNPFIPSTSDSLSTTIIGAIVPQNRRQLADAIFYPSPCLNKNDFHALYVPCMLFCLLQDSVIVSRDEWFQAFATKFDGIASLEGLWSSFAFGIHQLCYCGLLNEKRGRSKNDGTLYERTALVWCSGDIGC